MADVKEELYGKLGDQTWPTPEDALDATELQKFMTDVLGDRPIDAYYLALGPLEYRERGYPDPSLIIEVLSGELFYEFIFGKDLRRYDLSPVSRFFRLEERHEREAAVEGPPRNKVAVTIELAGGGRALAVQLIAYGEQGQDLSRFARRVASAAFEGPS